MKNLIEVKIWLGCHASYNDGFLFDKRYTITCEDDLDEAVENFEKHVINCIETERPFWIINGYITETYAEELYMADFETYIDGDFVKMDFGESIGALRSFLQSIESLDITKDQFLLSLAVINYQGMGFDKISEVAENLFYFEVDSKEPKDIGYAFAELTCLMDIEQGSETLKNYFDYDSYGRDLDFHVFDINGTYWAVDFQSV